ncbi:class I SAM-dependent methyltransferase [Paraburkholderia sp. SEWSISQ10-3 4]|uniref:methyltransferase domain-containing protein n=1 Tax=Paraburkholderia TaxID=1822464 RepID=UPI002259B18B|nr:MULTISPECIES: methyltransferase domain-containing protein [Paraburkholderia]MCX4140332.1 methyltransferase domain-containing protein [Paraburkholderia aspalathi]MDN7173019.1 class I SAM-dependent methyltransferase [Paraburkholderia sp. SEWSISQ10-3 4]MDQ6502658.1 class I SAM-dependent methyltransferase [Paraburkholderia aspalathi]
MNRKQKLLDGLNLKQLTGIEIGPLFRPVVTKSEGDVIYIDHADTESLRNKYRTNSAVDINAIVEIDAVWGAQTLRECLKNRTVDYVIASHVIEHVPDLITWLEELHSILNRQGELRLVVPDKRFTFDLIRRETELCDVLSAYIAHARVPQPICILDHLLNVSHVDPKRAWDAELNAESVERCHSFADAIPPATDSFQNGTYHDVHCWTFTPRSFASLFESLARAGLVHFACDNFFDTERYEIEFFVALKASDDQQQIVNSWAAMKSATTTSVPHIAASNSKSLADLLELERSRNLALSRKLEAAHRTIQDLRESTSWRVTGPLRSLGSTLRRKRQRA